MMNPSSTPPRTSNNNYNNGARQRIGGGDLPYRDDPNAPPSVRLESFTHGGYGPALDHHQTMEEKSKQLSLSQRCRSAAVDCCRACFLHNNNNRRDGNNNHNPLDSNTNLYYIDHFNDLPRSCSFGTSDDSGIWLNQSDPAGTIMSMLVWVLILYSAITIALLAGSGGVPVWASLLYTILACLALASHAKTSLTDPGTVPQAAVPTTEQRMYYSKLSMCSQCQTFKPPLSHHCRICGRCVSRMDHHCPWMNNCVGAGNLKHFFLFLVYTWIISVACLVLLGYNYFFCDNDACMFNVVLTQLARLMTLLSICSFLFTSSMLMNVTYGIMTGVGTIDRLKKKQDGTVEDADELPVQLVDMFGIGPYYTWFLPVDPIFPDFDRVMGYATPQRLLREQMREGYEPSVVGEGSVITHGNNHYA